MTTASSASNIDPLSNGAQSAPGCAIQDHQQSSIDAAWAAVDAATQAGFWSAASFWANLFGVVIVGIAAYFAYKAYSEAAKANGIALTSARRQDRAYVDFHDVHYACTQQVVGESAQTALRVEFKNFGHTPADRLTLKIDYALYDVKSGDRLKGAEEELDGLGAIMPQDTWGRTTTFAISSGDYLALQTGSFQIRVAFLAGYADAFGESHQLASTFIGSGAEATLGFVPGTRSNS